MCVAVASLGLSLGLVACANSEDNEGQGADPNFETVSIEHALGTAEITSKPERVVTLGQGSTETAIALGVVPVAMEEYTWGADDSGYLPWVKEAVEDKGGELPALVQGQDKLSAEEILKYEPDLILAPWSGVTEEQYQQLSEIAPTVAYPEEPWTITWDEQIETVATALGEKDKAQGLIDEIEAEFEKAKESEYKDTTFSFIYNQSSPTDLGIFMPTEQRVEFVTKLGLTVDPVIEEFKDSVVAGTDSASLSPENLDKLNGSDLIFTFYMDDDVRKMMHEDPAYSRVPAIAKGAEVAPTDQSFVTASSMINPLTVPWAIDRYKELINEAIEKSKS
ncbi:MAG TPA: iron-siderophore ABC transporter substrate-binding protein [Corynebacterium kroppenstedtii]|nr:iron-siderophore ABC transporter substrate-binding protein [Corynebacterium kroppenstedtii]